MSFMCAWQALAVADQCLRDDQLAEAACQREGVLVKALYTLQVSRGSVIVAQYQQYHVRSPSISTTADAEMMCTSPLQTVRSNKDKILSLRVLCRLAHTPEARLEVCRLEDFKHILHLLSERDRELSSQVLSTLKHFLGLQVGPHP
jgi:hypothetical protein